MPPYRGVRSKKLGGNLRNRRRKSNIDVWNNKESDPLVEPADAVDNLLDSIQSDNSSPPDSPQNKTNEVEQPDDIFGGYEINDLPQLVIESKNESGETMNVNGPPTGRRIVTITGFEAALNEAKSHGRLCEDGIIQITGEKKNGLHSILKCECIGCRRSFKMQIDCDKGDKALPVNEATVWGTYCAKSNFEATSHLVTTLEIPFLSFKKYQKHEKKMVEEWELALLQEFKEAGEAELKLSEEFVTINGQKLACIDVCVDGGWGKRSYGHGMSSLSGVAVIVGIKTKKVLFMGVRNKFCSICSTAEASNRKVAEHRCYKNWESTASSTSMEADIILEGFKCSISCHNLVYKRLLGDGDSSVFITVLKKVSYPGVEVEKIDCINHGSKRMNTKLFALLKDTKTHILEHRKLLKKLLPRFSIAFYGAINYNHQNQPRTTVYTLKEDILNLPFHIFGQHNKCKDYFCTPERKKEKNRVPEVQNTSLWAEIELAISRLATISNRLIYNLTSNLAERFMAQGAAFCLGKRVNLYQRGGYKTRMMAATFSYNRGAHFRTHLLQSVKRKNSPPLWKKLQAQYEKKKSKLKPKKLKKTSNRTTNSIDPSFVGDKDYGSNPAEPDVSDSDLVEKIKELRLKLQVTQEQQHTIEKDTIGQSNNDQWNRERKARITASSAYDIISMRDSTDSSSKLSSLLGYKSVQNVKSLTHGLIEEQEAIKEYEKKSNSLVQKCGLFVSCENGIFACSPDGLVGEDGIVEVKCPFSMIGYAPDKMLTVRGKNASYLVEAAQSDGSKSFQLKRKHSYFYQICFQLHVTGRKWCDFIVYSYRLETNGKTVTKVPFPCYVERIFRNEETEDVWRHMEPKLSRFWENDLAPEIVDSRYQRNLPFRQPQYRLKAKELASQKKVQTAASKAKKNKAAKV